MSRWYRQGNTSVSLLLLFVLYFIAPSLQAMTDAEIEDLFDQALEESESGDLSRAISIYETILDERPDLNRVRLELALANFRALNFVAARQLGERVLADPGTPEAVKRTIRQFLAEVESESQAHLWTPFISLGYIHDDNINVGPGASVIDVGGATFLLDPSATPKSGDGIQVNAGLAHRYLFSDTYDLLGDTAALAWQSQAGLFRNQYIGDGDFNLNVITFRTGPTLLAARKWRLQLTGEANHIEIGNEHIAWYAGLTPSFTWFFGGRTALTITAQAQDRNFVRTVDDPRDALYLSGGLSLGHTFKFDWRPTVRVGANIFTENADAARRANEGYAFNAGLNIQPINRTNLYVDYNWRTRNYDGPEPVFAVNRDEIQRRYSAGGNYRLDAGQYLEDLLLNLSWTRTENSSNVSLFTYERDQFVFSVSKSF